LWSNLGFLGIWAACGTPVGGTTGSPAEVTPEQLLARRILDETGVRGGLIVHLGCGEGKLTAALRAGDSYVVHGLDAGGGHVEAARRYVRSLGLYGKVSIEPWSGNRLPYIDNLVNLIVVADPAAVPQAELLRVLVPEGVAYLKTGGGWKKLVKPRPPEIDEWTHYLHDPSNNAVAHDAQVGPPRHLQWVSGPAWSRHHDHMASMSALVSAGGRIFYIMDEGPREAILLPSQWSLIARDAFNGTVLWKRPIAEWNTQLWPLKSGPNQLPRRLVAVGDRVYVTLGIDAPLVALDAATGRTVRTYAGTDHTDEVLDAEGTLFLLVGSEPNRWRQYRPTSTYVWDNTRYANKQWAWDKVERSVVAIQAETGAVLWKQQRRVAPLTLTVDRDRVLFYDGEKVVCLDRRNGAPRWTSQPILRKLPFPTGYGPTLVVQQDVALLSVESRSMTALATADGKTLWTAEHHPGGHMSPDDLLVINGLVWSGDVANSQNSGVFTGRDLHTGVVKSEFPPDVSPDWFHHRCYRSRATDRFFIASRTGFEFIDLDSKHWDFNHWVRGGCLYGFMPANGLLYAPPHDCGCFLESKLFGFNALAAESPGRAVPREVPDEGRLERGPAYGDPWPGPAADASEQWPSYRHDPQRSGSVKTAVPAELRRLWQADLGGRLSSVVVAEGKLFVSAVDAYTLYALDAGSGATAWTYTLGGPVDSPPTIYRGRVLFGSSDGWIYCLRAADGRLAWRFRAAPLDRRLMAYDRLESAWPVSGSVLVVRDALYAVAGRSAFLDGGMRLLRLDPRTGRKLSETLIDDRDPATGKNLQSKIKGQDMPVALPDILSCDGRSIYMRTQAFDFEGKPHDVAPLKLVVHRQQQKQQQRRRRGEAPEKTVANSAERTDLGDHLFSRSGFLDDSWYFRSYWMYGKAVDGNYGGWLIPGHYAPCGRLIVFDDACAYGFDRKPEYLCNAAVQEYYLYGADRTVTPESIDRVQKAARRINHASPKSGATSSDWATRKKFPLSAQSAVSFHWAEGNPPIQARALVLAGGTLFVAGPPDVVDEEEAFRNLDNPAIQAKLAAQAAALHGGLGGQLLAISAADGRKLAAYEIGAMPTFDGMAAAGGRLYLSTIGGKVLCLAGQGDPLPAAPEVKLVSLDTAVKPLSSEPGPPNGPSRAGDFARVVRAEVGTSPLGYHLVAEGPAPGWAVKRLPAPVTGKMVLKLRMRVTGDGELRNGFLVFGDSPEEPRLVKCGLRYAQERAMIVEGSLSSGRTTAQPCPAEEGVVYALEVTFDPSSGRVTLKTGQVTVTAKLAKPPAQVSYVGFAAIDAAADFSAVEVSVAK
jgi:outer membrane protein assembly factor BamB